MAITVIQIHPCRGWTRREFTNESEVADSLARKLDELSDAISPGFSRCSGTKIWREFFRFTDAGSLACALALDNVTHVKRIFILRQRTAIFMRVDALEAA